jgi:hypothetical protein
MKKFILILLCFISIAASAQTKWIPFYGPAKFYKQIQIDPVPSLPASADSITIVNCRDTLWIYDGSWHSLWPSTGGGAFTGDTIDMPGTHDVKLYQDIGGNFIVNIDGHGIYFEVINGQSILQINQVAVDSLLVGNTWFNAAAISAGGSGNDSTILSGSSVADQPTAKVEARRTAGAYAVEMLSDNGTDNASMATMAGGGQSYASMVSGSSTAILGKTGMALSDSLTLTYAAPGSVLMTSATKRIVTSVPPFRGYIEVYDSLFTAANASGITRYKFSIGEEQNGWELSKVQAFPEDSQGDKVPTFTVWRIRGTGAAVNMTSSGANFTTKATVDPTYKTVQTGDRLAVSWSFAGGSTYPYGANLHLTFIKP